MIIAQISDTHIALDTADANQRIRDFERTIADINTLDPAPDVIVHTEPTMVSTPLGGSEIALRYQAELLDAHGQPVKTWADTVHPPVVVRSIYKLTDSITESVTSTVATMFEEIAKGLPQPG